MKSVFLRNNISCAKGTIITSLKGIKSYPCIIKPLSNSGSRGVFYCENKNEAERLLPESLIHSDNGDILTEEVLEGKEYSVESIHFNNTTEVIQVTEKITSDFPENVEFGHIAPAMISKEVKNNIVLIVNKISKAFNFKNCASHTEIKINESGEIRVIETSPRLGGDYISSTLVPNSTGFNIEESLIKTALKQPQPPLSQDGNFCAIFFLKLKQGAISKIDEEKFPIINDKLISFRFELQEGDKIAPIKNSLDRYGYYIIKADTIQEIFNRKVNYFKYFEDAIEILP